MCYGYGLRESELNGASPQFVSLFLQGHAEKELELHKDAWRRARFIASTMSIEAARHRFWWEQQQQARRDIPQEVWDRFTLDLDGKQGSWNDYKPN